MTKNQVAVPSKGSVEPKHARRALLAGSLVGILLLTACTAGADHVEADGTLVNCGHDVAVGEPPERIVVANSAAVENLLALGVEERIVGAIGNRDSISPSLRVAFDQLELFDTGKEFYPSVEVVLEAEPEFVYSAYRSAFERVSGLLSRDEFEELGVQTYLSPAACPEFETSGEPLDFADLWEELSDLGTLFGVEERAAALVSEQRSAIKEVRMSLPVTEPLSVFWWDIGTNEPWAGVCCGAPGMIMRELGLVNIFDDVKGDWKDVSWEQVAERDPDIIVMADFGDGDIAKKRKFIAGDKTLRLLKAFQDERVVVLPFSQTTPGLQNVKAIQTIGQALRVWDAKP